MGLEKLLKKLQKHLNRVEDQSPAARCDRIDALLEKLALKEEKFKAKLSSEHDPAQRKQLNLELRIISLELKKGLARRKELKDKCK